MKINWKPDKERLMPLYQQICKYIRGEIESGNWPIGTVLPSQRYLSQIFEVNRSTVVQALEYLKSEGILEGHGRKGTVVVNNTWSLYLSREDTNWNQYTQTGAHKPNQPLIQAINQLEFDDEMIRMGTGEISPDLFPTEDMQLISLGITPVGSTILLERPSYLRSIGIFQSAGMLLKDVEMDSEGMEIGKLKDQCSRRHKNFLYTIPTFQNPTGLVMTKPRREDLMNFCAEEGIPIIEDDAYGELWLDEEPLLPMKASALWWLLCVGRTA